MEQYYYLHVIIQYLGEGGTSLAVAWKHSPTHSMESHTEYQPPTGVPWLALSMVMTVLIAITAVKTTNSRCQATGSLQRCATSARGGAAIAWISLNFQANPLCAVRIFLITQRIGAILGSRVYHILCICKLLLTILTARPFVILTGCKLQMYS